LAFLALSIAAGAMLALPLSVRKVIDQGFFEEHAKSINQHFLVLLGLVIIIAIFSATRFYLVMWLGERIVADIRTAVYRHIIRMDPTFFEVTRTGEVLSRLTTDTTLVQAVVGAGISIALRSSFMLIGSLVMLMVTSPHLTGLILVIIPFVILPLIFFGRKVRVLSRLNQDCTAKSSAIAGETLNAIQMVQSFTLEEFHSTQFARSVETTFVTAKRRLLARALLTAFAVFIVFSAVIVVVWIGAQFVITGSMTNGELGQFLIYAIVVATSTAALSEVWGDIQRALGAMERLLELLNSQSQINAPKCPLLFPERGTEKIQFKNVKFSYPSRPGHDALSNFSLEVESGETVALVGPSGAGKSTVFQLLLRFYDPQSGTIKIGDVDISKVDPKHLRKNIGIVPQETVLFAADVLENIRYGNPMASDDEIRNAAVAAVADEFVNGLPDEYHSFLGERGVRFSGGQQQRIAISRAMLKNAPILLLDEATSSLDAESEQRVQEALEHLMKNRTTIVIAHRLATILKADRIVVMEQGQIVAIGSHHELLNQDGLYARLAELQFSNKLFPKAP